MTIPSITSPKNVYSQIAGCPHRFPMHPLSTNSHIQVWLIFRSTYHPWQVQHKTSVLPIELRADLYLLNSLYELSHKDTPALNQVTKPPRMNMNLFSRLFLFILLIMSMHHDVHINWKRLYGRPSNLTTFLRQAHKYESTPSSELSRSIHEGFT